VIELNRKRICAFFLLAVIWSTAAYNAIAQKKTDVKPPPPVAYSGKNASLQYAPDPLGNRIPDFSYAGFEAGEQPIPTIPVKVYVPVTTDDVTLRIQSALDYVASLPLDKNGYRGAVLLDKGVYHVQGSLRIAASGVVLRGSGMLDDGTRLIGEGTTRETLITIAGTNNKVEQKEMAIKDTYVPVNALSFHIAASLKVGDNISIRRPCTQKWIDTLGTAHFGGGITAIGWKPGQRELVWDRVVTAVSGDVVTIDAPITTALDSNYGGGYVSSYTWPGRIEHSGVENLTLQSSYDASNPKDEAHRWMAINIENAKDIWVRQIQFKHFAGSAVQVLETAKRVTVEDCKSLQPISEIGGQRRMTFITFGQQCLFQRCYAMNGIHDFATGFCASGPNAFVQCTSSLPYSFSGGIDSWSAGILFDVVNSDGNALSFFNRGQDGQGAGWTAANSLFWNCSAARIDCYKPPTANNWSYASWSQFAGDGYWAESNNSINPRSFYYAQLRDRVGDKPWFKNQLLLIESDATSSPSVELAMALTKDAAKPQMQLDEFIDLAAKRKPIDVERKNARSIEEIGVKKAVVHSKAPLMQVTNGWIVRGNAVTTGARRDVPWWSGSSRSYALKDPKPHITRFVPGRTGFGLTDDLDSLTSWMKEKNWVGIEHNYGLWYDRRRDDHERIRRMDGDVWPPFYELPFARSGKELAWDGLSKYDLTKYNTFYWSRLAQFATLADEKGLVLVHDNYFQHNIIEAGAHYADFPWRTANNINDTGFPEPPPYAGDKRIFMAEQFYDVSNEQRKALHRLYIRQCLDNFKDNNGVIQSISAEFTGPLHFVQFWLDVIAEWEKETGRKALIALSTTKDVQDAILADPARSSVVDIIDIRYWHYQEDGTTYAPEGGQNLAPRQHARLLKPKRSSFQQVYRAVREYRDKFPGKAVMYSGDNSDNLGWAVFMASGSLANIPRINQPVFYTDAAGAKAITPSKEDEYVLESANAIIVFGRSKDIQIDLSNKTGSYRVRWINPANGAVLGKESNITAGKHQAIRITRPDDAYSILWLSRK
jgi:hypothetical protein